MLGLPMHENPLIYTFGAKAVAVLILAAQATHAQVEEVVIADLLDWQGFPTHFVDAPTSVSVEMQSALSRAIEGGQLDCALANRTYWLCQARLRYFRGVAGNGSELMEGFVCQSDIGIPVQQSYAERLLALAKCAYFEWDQEHHEYHVIDPDEYWDVRE